MLLYDVEVMALELMRKYNLIGWRFQFSNAKRSLGECCYRQRIIKLSQYHAHSSSEESIRNTILHEIAHVLTPGHNHDWIWQMKCIDLGISPNRCASVEEAPKIEGKYKAYCPTCNKVKGTFHRKIKRNYLCSCCRTRLIIKVDGEMVLA